MQSKNWHNSRNNCKKELPYLNVFITLLEVDRCSKLENKNIVYKLDKLDMISV